jgi:mono/diheme cytochrome c family protein
MNRTAILGMLVLAAVAVAACYDPGGQQEDKFEAQREVFADRYDAAQNATPEPTETPANPDATPDPNSPAAQMVQGELVGDFWAGLCASCHGANREGGLGPALTSESMTEPDAFYIDCITNGRDGTLMQPYGGGNELSDTEVVAIVNWLRSE